MHLYANTHVDRQVEKSIKNELLVYIKLSNTLQFLYKPQFGQPWRCNIMFKALKVANKNKKLNIFLFFYINMVWDFVMQFGIKFVIYPTLI